MRWSSVLASHEACVGGCSGAASVSAREGVRDGVASIVWLEAKGKKKYSSQFFFLGGTSRDSDGGGEARVPPRGL